MNKAIKLAAALSIGLIGCANRPESIHASFVSFEKYIDLDCAALETKMSTARADLAKYSKMQDDKANADAVGVFLLLIPISKLSGDHEADVARTKGEIEAIETAQVKNKCRGGPQAPTVTASPAVPGVAAKETGVDAPAR